MQPKQQLSQQVTLSSIKKTADVHTMGETMEVHIEKRMQQMVET